MLLGRRGGKHHSGKQHDSQDQFHPDFRNDDSNWLSDWVQAGFRKSESAQKNRARRRFPPRPMIQRFRK
jgi:hypothetical protein